MSTLRPSWEPSSRPSARGMYAASSASLASKRVWWSLTLISTSCVHDVKGAHMTLSAAKLYRVLDVLATGCVRSYPVHRVSARACRHLGTQKWGPGERCESTRTTLRNDRNSSPLRRFYQDVVNCGNATPVANPWETAPRTTAPIQFADIDTKADRVIAITCDQWLFRNSG